MEWRCNSFRLLIGLPNDHSGFQHLNWAFHAGLTGNPVMAYELLTKIAEVSGGKEGGHELMNNDVLIIE